VVLREFLENGDRLIDGLALAENYLGQAIAQRPVQVEAGKAQVLVRQAAQAVEGFVHRGRALLDRIEQLAEFIKIHHRIILPDPVSPGRHSGCHCGSRPDRG